MTDYITIIIFTRLLDCGAGQIAVDIEIEARAVQCVVDRNGAMNRQFDFSVIGIHALKVEAEG
jgi:hypothetical protein